MSKNTINAGSTGLCDNGLDNTSFKKVIQSIQISSMASSSKDSAYAIKNSPRSSSDNSDVREDFCGPSSALGLVREYMALNRAGMALFGRDPSNTWSKLMTAESLPECCCRQAVINVSRDSKASATKERSSNFLALLRILADVKANEAELPWSKSAVSWPKDPHSHIE